MQTIASTPYLATAAAKRPLARRLVAWVLAFDAGYRNAHRLACATDESLADIGLTRREAKAEATRLGASGPAQITGAGW